MASVIYDADMIYFLFLSQVVLASILVIFHKE